MNITDEMVAAYKAGYEAYMAKFLAGGAFDKDDATRAGLAAALSVPASPAGTGADELRRVQKAIALVFQMHDLGRVDDEGTFTCSAAQIDLLDELSRNAAIAAIAARASPPAPAPAVVVKAEPVAWCQPNYEGNIHPRKFIVRFEDAERGDALFDDEAEAYDFFERANTNWNCYLFGLMPRNPAALVDAPAAPRALADGLMGIGWQALCDTWKGHIFEQEIDAAERARIFGSGYRPVFAAALKSGEA